MREHNNVWSKVSCPERLSVSGPPALNGEQAAYRDVVPFARRVVGRISRSRAMGHGLAASQSQRPYARRRAAGRFHPCISRPQPNCGKSCWSTIPCGSTGPKSGEADHVARQTLSRRSRHDDFRRRAIAQRLLAQPILHVADEGGEPRSLQGERARLSRRMGDERRSEAGGAGARSQSLHRAGRQHLFPRQDRRDRRHELPADGGQHDRHDRGRISRDDGQGRPLDRRQSQVGEDGDAQRIAAAAAGQKKEA